MLRQVLHFFLTYVTKLSVSPQPNDRSVFKKILKSIIKVKANMTNRIPEKARLLEKLRQKGFKVPDFIYVPSHRFDEQNFLELNMFLDKHRESYKVIARSAHPLESAFKGGTFDSLETYADIGGIKYARKKMLKIARSSKQLSIKRQQVFNDAPQLNMDEMGIIVMPFVNGSSVMAKKLLNHWEFGYCIERDSKVQNEPYITKVPHDRRLLKLSEDIQKALGFRCEIEYIISSEGDIHVVQAKDISGIETLEEKESERSIVLDGIRRIRKRRNYRERPIYIMDNKAFYVDIISQCEDLIHSPENDDMNIDSILESINAYEKELEAFALKHQRFAIIGFAIHDSAELYQIANHYLDDYPDFQKTLSKALYDNLYKIDIFLAEADTLIAKHKFRINLCSHDAYGIDTVRNPIWSAYWHVDRHAKIIKEFKRLGFKTGDTISIDIDAEDRPIIYRH